MPRLARLYIRSALVCLAVGGLLGGLLLWNKGWPFAPRLSAWLPVHIMLVTWGWLWNLTLGVTFWILPRFSRPPPGASAGLAVTAAPASRLSRGSVWLAWAAYACLNAGLVAAALAPLLPGPWPSALAGLLQLFAAVTFVAHAWARVKPSGR